MGVIGQKINMGFYDKRQRSPTKNGQVVKPQEPTSLNHVWVARVNRLKYVSYPKGRKVTGTFSYTCQSKT